MKLAIVMCLALVACSPAAKSVEAESVYTAQMLACVDRASTLAESKACRAQVVAEWAKDGGAHD